MGGDFGSSNVVNTSPRNSHEPCRRDTRFVCLPCQPSPACSASGFSMTGAVSTNTFTSPPSPGDDELRQVLQLAAQNVVVVAVARINRDIAAVRTRNRRQRVLLRCVGQAERDHAARLRPQACGLRPLLHPFGQPAHLAVLAGCQEIDQSGPRLSPELCGCKPHGVEPEGQRLVAYQVRSLHRAILAQDAPFRAPPDVRPSSKPAGHLQASRASSSRQGALLQPATRSTAVPAAHKELSK